MIDAQLNNFNQAILTALDTYAGQTCLKIKQRGHFRDISYAKLRTLTFRMVKFLQHQGITDGERVAIAANNCPEWMVLCFATLLSGGVVVPLRPSLAPNVLHRTLQDSGARLVLLDNETFIRTTAAKAKGNRGTLPQLKTILSLTKTAESGGKVVPAAAVLSEAVSLTAQELRAIQTNAEKVAPDSVAVIHYTSDRSGELRGAVFDHARLLEIVQHVAAWFGLDEDDLGFSLLTWSYSSSLRTTLHHFLSGVTTVLGEVGTAAEDMQQTSPTVTLNMPYFFERFYEGVMEETLVNMPEASQDVFRWALAKGREFMAAGSSATEELRQAYTRADMTFFSQIRGQIGGRMHRFYSTGAPLSQEIAEFFEAIGLPALNVYNLTEAGGFPTISSLHDRRSGSCGRTAPGFEIRIADDGEVLVRSNMIMREYWQRPEDTRQLVDSAGWLHTGDLGYLDEDGYLYLTGRKQPVEVLSTGRKITPAVIEEALMQSPLIFQAVVFAEGRPYVSAFIVPDLEAFGAHFQGDEADGDEPTADTEPSASLNWFWPRESDDFDPMITAAHPRIKVLLDKVIGEINRYRDRWEHIKTFSLLDQAHSQVANELGQLKTTDRQAILQRYAGLVESMYPSAPRVGDTAVTRVEVSPERMRDLLEKESILDAWIADAGIEFLLRLANEKHIDASSMVHVCDVAASIAQMENEERPL